MDTVDTRWPRCDADATPGRDITVLAAVADSPGGAVPLERPGDVLADQGRRVLGA